MLLLFQIFLVHLLACDPSESDPVTGLSAGCNYAGLCVSFSPSSGICFCCKPETQGGTNCGEHWTCDPENPLEGCVWYSGNSCSEVVEYFYINLGFRLLDVDANASPNLYCNTNPKTRYESRPRVFDFASYDIGPQVQFVTTARGWPGTVHSALYCDTCTPVYPCTLGVDADVNATAGSTYLFQVDLRQYYNLSCSTNVTLTNPTQQTECEANYDYGQSANFKWQLVRGQIEQGDTAFIDTLNDLLWAQPNSSNNELGLGWNNSRMVGMSEFVPEDTIDEVWITSLPTFSPTHPPTLIPTQTPTPSPSQNPTEVPTIPPTAIPTQTPTESPSQTPTALPTISPTESPTDSPTQSPTPVPKMCEPYINLVDDLVFEGVGSNCRAGFDSEVDVRIRKAQANRMFQLCENWCLFQADDPEAESWYWDPWKACWREQYAGVGPHMSYCSRVIKNPDTIEMQFVTHRSTICQSH